MELATLMVKMDFILNPFPHTGAFLKTTFENIAGKREIFDKMTLNPFPHTLNLQQTSLETFWQKNGKSL